MPSSFELDTNVRMLQVEPAIIGGIIIDVGDKHIDLSIMSRVKKIEQLVRESA